MIAAIAMVMARRRAEPTRKLHEPPDSSIQPLLEREAGAFPSVVESSQGQRWCLPEVPLVRGAFVALGHDLELVFAGRLRTARRNR